MRIARTRSCRAVLVALGLSVAATAQAAEVSTPVPPRAPAGKEKPAAATSATGTGIDETWSRRCVRNQEDGKELCYVEQYAVAMPEGRVLLNILFGHLGPEGKPRTILTVPLGIMLLPGLALSVDGGAPMTVPLESCNTGGCRAVVDMDASSLDTFARGRRMSVRYVDAGHAAVEVPVALEGLAAAMARLTP